MMVTIIGISFAPLILVSSFILYEFHKTFEEKLTAHLLETVQKHKQHIDAFLRANLQQILVLSKTFSYEELGDPDFLRERLAVLQQVKNPVLVDLGVVDMDGSQVAYAGPFILGHADYSEAAWFLESAKHEYYISDVFAGLRGLPHFIIAVRGKHDGKTWILRATIDFVAFKNLVENIRIGETGLAYIVNKDGEFQVQPSGDLRLSDSLFSRLRGGESGSGQARVVEGQDDLGHDNIYVAASLNEGNWFLIYQQSSADAFSAFWKAVKIAVFIIILAFSAIVTVAYVMVGRIVSRLAKVDREKRMVDQQIVETGKLAAVGELAAGIAHEINNPL
ncbi:MAG: cache domain-containing protein, partial [Planctomycetota bacterium]